jgi:hypothetical protein
VIPGVVAMPRKKIGRAPKNSVLNPAGVWEKLPDGAMNLARGYNAEQAIGHYFNDAGFLIIEGPSGSGGHGINVHGFDGVAFKPETAELIIYDNKSTKPSGVKEVTALKENLVKNLEELIERIEKRQATDFKIPHADKILDGLRKALKSASKRGVGWPDNVKLYVFGVSGRATHLRPKLVKAIAKAGLPIKFASFTSWEELKKIRTSKVGRGAANREVKKLTDSIIVHEPKAAEAIVKRARNLVGKGTGKAARFIEKRLPKLIAESVLKGSAKAAARRASSLVPVVGWAFDAQDASSTP